MSLRQQYGDLFERFWSAYPRKVNKGAAFKAFEKLKLDARDVDELVAHLDERKRTDVKWIEGKFVPHAASFLNGHRWEDEYQRVRKQAIRGAGPATEAEEDSKRRWAQAEHQAGREVPASYQHYIERH